MFKRNLSTVTLYGKTVLLPEYMSYEDLSARHELSPNMSLVREVPEALKTTEDSATALGCSLELEDKTPLLKIEHMLDRGIHRC